MSKLRISIVGFLNTAPLVWGFTDGPLEGRYDLSFTVPSLCAEELRSGNADIAIIPAIEYQRIEDLVVLPDIAVAAKGEVRSILLLAKKPVQLAKRIALDTNSRSSIALVHLLCRGLWGISPEFVNAAPDPSAMLAEADAALLIGDPALRVRIQADALLTKQAAGPGAACCTGEDGEQPVPGVDTLFIYDVAQQWREMTGRPCVLAIWAARRDAVTPQVVADFLASRDYGLAHIGDIAEGAALKLDLPPNQLESYLRDNIDFSLDAENLDGLNLYFNECARAGLIPSAGSGPEPRPRPVEFAAAPERAARAASRESALADRAAHGERAPTGGKPVKTKTMTEAR
jgi:chorismate dehydratase